MQAVISSPPGASSLPAPCLLHTACHLLCKAPAAARPPRLGAGAVQVLLPPAAAHQQTWDNHSPWGWGTRLSNPSRPTGKPPEEPELHLPAAFRCKPARGWGGRIRICHRLKASCLPGPSSCLTWGDARLRVPPHHLRTPLPIAPQPGCSAWDTGLAAKPPAAGRRVVRVHPASPGGFFSPLQLQAEMHPLSPR